MYIVVSDLQFQILSECRAARLDWAVEKDERGFRHQALRFVILQAKGRKEGRKCAPAQRIPEREPEKRKELR